MFIVVGIFVVIYSLFSVGIENNWFVLVNDIMWEYFFLVILLLYFIYVLGYLLVMD